jgi:hypothetical protein
MLVTINYYYFIVIYVKGKAVLVQAVMACRGSGGKAPLILNLSYQVAASGQVHAPITSFRERRTNSHKWGAGEQGGPRNGLDVILNISLNPAGTQTLDRPVRSLGTN